MSAAAAARHDDDRPDQVVVQIVVPTRRPVSHRAVRGAVDREDERQRVALDAERGRQLERSGEVAGRPVEAEHARRRDGDAGGGARRAAVVRPMAMVVDPMRRLTVGHVVVAVPVVPVTANVPPRRRPDDGGVVDDEVPAEPHRDRGVVGRRLPEGVGDLDADRPRRRCRDAGRREDDALAGCLERAVAVEVPRERHRRSFGVLAARAQRDGPALHHAVRTTRISGRRAVHERRGRPRPDRDRTNATRSARRGGPAPAA